MKAARIFKQILQVPRIIWGFCAIFGAFFLGMIVGFSDTESSLTHAQAEFQQMSTYTKIIEHYEELDILYADQEHAFSIALDRNHPEEAADALELMKRYRDLILLQRGRIDALRTEASLPPEGLSKEKLQMN